MKRNQKQDEKTISDSVAEINRAAKTLNVDPIVIRVAKYLSKSNDRDTVYKWVENHMGDCMGINIIEID